MVTFIDKMKACEGCTKDFTIEETFSSWFLEFRDYAEAQTNQAGPCKDSWNAEKKAVIPEKFMTCLNPWLKVNGARWADDVNTNDKETKITSFKQSVKLIYIDDSANEGVKVLHDMKRLCDGANVGDTYSFSQNYFSYETYVVFQEEAIMNVCLALVAVFVVLMIVTANFTVTMFILLCVALVDLFLMGLLTFWSVTLNSVTVINSVIAIGLAVDYSAHIGHAYLMSEPPENDEEGNPLNNH